MRYRKLGNTGLEVSEIGLGGEWLERQTPEAVKAVVDRCAECGINILDCWMSEPNVRSNIGAAIAGQREKWIIQGQIGSAWVDGKHERTRNMFHVRRSFQDLLDRMQTDYMDIGMIHFVDDAKDFHEIMNGEFYAYVQELKDAGVIKHVGMSTHNPEIVKLAALSGKIEMLLFSVNPAYDMLPPTENIEDLFAEEYDPSLGGMNVIRAEAYDLCEKMGVGLTVMKGYAGGRLLSADLSPFGVALTPVQCIHYALTRPAVASVLVGYSVPEHVDEAIAYENASDAEKDYAAVLANAPSHTYAGQCTYCGHCAPCPAGIDIAMVNKLYDLAVLHDEIPGTLREHYRHLSAHASDCISCRDCETRCPFAVGIAARMEKIAELFGE